MSEPKLHWLLELAYAIAFILLMIFLANIFTEAAP